VRVQTLRIYRKSFHVLVSFPYCANGFFLLEKVICLFFHYLCIANPPASRSQEGYPVR
jgi:hypothetical protein